MSEFMQNIKNLEDTIKSLISPKALGIVKIKYTEETEKGEAIFSINSKRIEIRYNKHIDTFQVYVQKDENAPLEMIFEGELNQFNPTTLLD